MSWLIWRQHRKQLLFTVLGLAALAAVMVPSGLAMHRAAADLGLADCVLRANARAAHPHSLCGSALERFSDQYTSGAVFGILFVFAPLLVGLFWGAPRSPERLSTARTVWCGRRASAGDAGP